MLDKNGCLYQNLSSLDFRAKPAKDGLLFRDLKLEEHNVILVRTRFYTTF